MSDSENKNYKTITIRVPEEFRTALRIEALKRGTTLVNLIVEAVSKEINYKGNK